MIAIPVLIVILVAALVMTRIIKLNRSQDAEAASLKKQITQMEKKYEMEMKTRKFAAFLYLGLIYVTYYKEILQNTK